MAGKRNYEWPLATEWDAAAFLTQDKSGGVTQRVSPALVETKLEADGFPKIPSPSANEVAVYGVGGWDSVKLVDANIDAAAAIGWGKVSKTGAVATDVGALDIAPIQAAGQLSGFADKANITQSYNEANRTVTTSHPSGTIVMYWKGARITRASPWVTAAHAATVNANYFYYSSDGVNFNWSTTPWEFEDIQVAMVRFGTSLKLPIRECHGLMDPAAHEEFHDRVWTYRKSGGALTAGTYALQVADDASITPGVDACVLRDEDLATNLDALPQGSYTVCIPVDGEFSPQTLTFPFPYAPSSFIRYYPADTGVGTTGQTGKFYNVYRVGIPTMEPNSPVRWLWIAPQAEYDSAALASAESFASLRLGDLKLGTSEYIPVERIVYKSGAAYASTGKVWIEGIQPLERVAGVVSSVGVSVLSGSGAAGEPTYWASPSSLASETAANFRTRIAALPVANPTATGTLTAPDVVVSNLAGTGTRPAAIDSTGKLVVSGGENSFAVKSASFTLSASTERVIRTQGAITVTLPAASSLQGYSYTFLQEQVGGGALTFSPPEPWFSSVSASAWVEHAGSWGFSIAWRRADLTSDGLNWLATLQ
jgi:hypothetical protein